MLIPVSARLCLPAPSSSMRALLVFLLLVLIAKLLLAACVPLISGEIYYRIWAEDLQWGYFDHPPVIAWWIRFGVEVFGDNRLGVRILPTLASVFGSLGIYWLAREFEVTKELARRSVVWVQSVWMIVLVGVLAVPDAPAAFFWILTCACAARAARLNSIRCWLLAGALAGLGCLSKYTCLFLAPGLLLWLVTSQRYRGQLATAGPWLAALVALAVFAPNIVWNATHDWGTFGKQLGRAIPEDFSLIRPMIWIVLQFLFLGPMIFVLAARGGWQVARGRFESNQNTLDCMHFIASISAPLLVYMLFHGLHSEIKWNWLAPGFAGLALLALLGADRLAEPRYRQVALAVPASALGFFALAVIVFFTPLLARSYDVGRELREWPQFAGHMTQNAIRHEAQWIGSGIYRTNALLYQHISDQSLAVQIIERFRYPPDNPSWQMDPNSTGLVFEEVGFFARDRLEACFVRVEKLPSEYRTDFSGQRYEYDVYRVSGARKDWVKEGC